MSHWNGNIATINGGPRDLPKSYVEARDIYEPACDRRGKACGRIAHETYIREGSLTFEILYHGRAIITYYSDGRVEINTHGYQTASTRDRMNRAGIRIGMQDGVPFVVRKGLTAPFVDGMILSPNGHDVSYPVESTPAGELEDIIRRRRRNLARRRRWINGTIKKQDFPDVFYWACKSGGYSRHQGTIPEVFSTDLELGLTRTRRPS